MQAENFLFADPFELLQLSVAGDFQRGAGGAAHFGEVGGKPFGWW
jgi:hypothetical protein